VWDSPDIPTRGLALGQATGSAAPLGWAHAEYLQLLAMVALSGFPDVVLPARRRYTEVPPHDPPYVWSHKHRITRLAEGRRFKVQLPRPGSVHYTFDDWATSHDVEAGDTTLGVWVAEVPAQKLAKGAKFAWTAHYGTGWEGTNFEVTVD
jgi:glucoamylase